MRLRRGRDGGGGGGGAGAGEKWACEACGFSNRLSNEMCGGRGAMGCKAERPEQYSAMVQQRGAKRDFSALVDGWKCACGFTNRDTNDICGGKGPMGCKTPKESASLGTPGQQWRCACGWKNRPQNHICGGATGSMGCKAPRPADETPQFASFGGLGSLEGFSV